MKLGFTYHILNYIILSLYMLYPSYMYDFYYKNMANENKGKTPNDELLDMCENMGKVFIEFVLYKS